MNALRGRGREGGREREEGGREGERESVSINVVFARSMHMHIVEGRCAINRAEYPSTIRIHRSVWVLSFIRHINSFVASCLALSPQSLPGLGVCAGGSHAVVS